MKALLFILLIAITSRELNSQNITGIWRGKFNINDKKNNRKENMFNYELQILQTTDGNLKGVTYTYKTKEYYGKAAFEGKVYKSNSIFIVNESKIIDVEKNEKTDVCLMSCKLKYIKDKSGNEYLIGNFTSKRTSSKDFCFEGLVELKRFKTTTFPIEPYLKISVKKKSDSLIKSKPILRINDTIIQHRLRNDTIGINPKNKEIKIVNLDQILTIRENKLIANVKVNSKEIKVLIFDNGIIDNDTISIYLDSSKIINKNRVSSIPISFDLKFTSEFQKHEIIATADNMGEIPPNTALIIIQSAKKRIEIPIMTNFKTNIKILIEYNSENSISIQRF
ncbi:MAG: hypothetical protein Q8K64_13330 [Sediminibacterium sp.]|nr:hypothetical protein [Sediminibacterium sp.]